MWHRLQSQCRIKDIQTVLLKGSFICVYVDTIFTFGMYMFVSVCVMCASLPVSGSLFICMCFCMQVCVP